MAHDQSLFQKRKRANAFGLAFSMLAMTISMLFLFWILINPVVQRIFCN